jgi:hypothetical protein
MDTLTLNATVQAEAWVSCRWEPWPLPKFL